MVQDDISLTPTTSDGGTNNRRASIVFAAGDLDVSSMFIDSEQVPGGQVMYNFEITECPRVDVTGMGATKWVISKTFSDFEDLHKHLGPTALSLQVLLPDMPSSRTFGRKVSSITEERSEKLPAYLRIAVSQVQFTYSGQLEQFVRPPGFKGRSRPDMRRQSISFQQKVASYLNEDYQTLTDPKIVSLGIKLTFDSGTNSGGAQVRETMEFTSLLQLERGVQYQTLHRNSLQRIKGYEFLLGDDITFAVAPEMSDNADENVMDELDVVFAEAGSLGLKFYAERSKEEPLKFAHDYTDNRIRVGGIVAGSLAESKAGLVTSMILIAINGRRLYRAGDELAYAGALGLMKAERPLTLTLWLPDGEATAGVSTGAGTSDINVFTEATEAGGIVKQQTASRPMNLPAKSKKEERKHQRAFRKQVRRHSIIKADEVRCN